MRRAGALGDRRDPTDIDGDRYSVELLPHLLARSRMAKHQPGKFRHLGCVGVDLRDWQDAVEGLPDDRRVPRSSIRLEAGRYAVIAGSGSKSALYHAWRRGFDDWLVVTGECPKPGRLYARVTSDGGHGKEEQHLSLFVPLETPTATVRRTRSRPTVRDGQVAVPNGA